MEPRRFAGVVTTALVSVMMSSASSVWAETCFVDLEEETADLEQMFVLHVGHDEGQGLRRAALSRIIGGDEPRRVTVGAVQRRRTGHGRRGRGHVC